MKTFKLFTKEECDEIIETLSNEYDLVHTSKQYRKEYSSYNKVTVDKPFWFYDRIKKWVDTELNINVESTLVFVKYNEGDSFPIHIDRVPQSEYHHDWVWNINVVLNDDYEGGEFIINDVHHKESAGTIYYYTSDTPHGVTEITKGERYVFLYHIRERDIRKVKSLL